jgi:molybdate transport system substrate-binding protein
MIGMARRVWLALTVGALMAAPVGPEAEAEDKSVLVFAAASLKNALDEAGAAYAEQTGVRITASYAASSALAKQIEGGAPADVFISADLDWMKYLSDKNLTKKDTELKLLGNQIVLVAPKDSTATTTIAPNFDLAALIGDGKLAMADVKAVPAGKYGKAALEKLGVWASVESKVAQAENVRAALKLVSTGEAALGIVYTTDAVAEPGVKVIGTFPEDSHPAIVYPVGELAASKSADAAAFIEFLQTPKAQELFKAQGFTYLAATN